MPELAHVAFLQYRAHAALHAPRMTTATDEKKNDATKPEPRTYAGACHCKAVRIEVTMPEPEKAFACNCSICSKAGWLMAFMPASDLKVLAGEDQLSDYQFNTKNAHLVFCKTCGARSFSRGKGKDGKEWAVVNLRCLDGLDPTKLPLETFDGASA